MITNASQNADGVLSIEDFRNWLKTHPGVFETFNKIFPKDLWHLDKGRQSNTPMLEKPKTEPQRKGCLSCLQPKIKPSNQPIPVLSEFNNGSGYVHMQQGRKMELFFVTLNKNMLYIYADELSYLPIEVIFIEGCYIHETNDF